MLQIKQKLQEWWISILSFARYSHSLLMARLTMVMGFLTAVVGTLDWSPLLGVNIDTGFSKNQVIWLGIITFVKGIFDEIARRAKGVVTPQV